MRKKKTEKEIIEKMLNENTIGHTLSRDGTKIEIGASDSMYWNGPSDFVINILFSEEGNLKGFSLRDIWET